MLKMKDYLKILIVILLSLHVQSKYTISSYNAGKNVCSSSFCFVKTQCSMYCFEMIKPLFKEAESSDKKIKDLNKEMEAQEHNKTLIVMDLSGKLQLTANQVMQLEQKLKMQNMSFEETLVKKTKESNEAALNFNISLNLKSYELNDLKRKLTNRESLIVDLEKIVIAEKTKLQQMGTEKDKKILELYKKVQQLEADLHSLTLEFMANRSRLSNDLRACNTKLDKTPKSSCLNQLTDVYNITIPGIDQFPVACDSKLAGSGWTVIQRRQDGSINFNRDWSEYREGFGDIRGEFFIGLEKLHLLTISQPHELYIYLKDFKDDVRYAHYDSFIIGNEENGYKIERLGEFRGDAGDEMEPHKNMKFTTFDRDNDLDDSNCGESFQSGWWFKNCYTCNLNGQYIANDVEANGINWNQWHSRSLKFTQMMIRPFNKD